MTRAQIYSLADHTSQWWEKSFSRGTFSSIEKILLHTTETPSWPGYDAGAKAPTLTYFCKTRRWRQHNYINTSARALVDPTSTPVRENRDNVIQIEIIAYADERVGKTVAGSVLVSQLSEANLQDLADFINWVRAEWGGPALVSANFIPYPESYGNSVVRMSSSKYDAFKGVLGHMHASGNAHGDPGALNVDKIMSLAVGRPSEPGLPGNEVEVVTDQDVQRIANAILFKQVWPDNADSTKDGVEQSSLLNNIGWQTAYLENVLAQLKSIATQVGAPVDVDEQAVAAAVVASIKTTLHDVVVDTLAGLDNVDEQAIADKVVARIGSALTGPTV